MHPMIGKTFKGIIDGQMRIYEIVSVDNEGWIKIKREGAKESYLHEDIHKHFLAKLGYQRRQS